MEEGGVVRVGTLIARGVVGGLMIGHGTQKLFGWFDGSGRESTGQFFEQLGLRPGKRHATAAGMAEAGGGALLALGLFTPAAAAALSGVMFTAIQKVHRANGPWVSSGGYEYNAVLIAALAMIAEAGPGPISLDHAFGIERKGMGWALVAIGAGAAGSALALKQAEQVQPTEAAEGQAGDPASQEQRAAA